MKNVVSFVFTYESRDQKLTGLFFNALRSWIKTNVKLIHSELSQDSPSPFDARVPRPKGAQ